MNYNVVKEYCTGCGLCCAILGNALDETEKGFLKPNESIRNFSFSEADFFERICEGGYTKLHPESAWGNLVQEPYYAWATDKLIRDRASSGGVITACAQYLLKSGDVDGILQTKVSEDSQIRTQMICSKSCKKIIECCGSRYTISSPLQTIAPYLESEKRFAYIGKPCEVMALRNYAEIDSRVKKRIPIMISFLCAGMPSYEAGEKLLIRLGTTEKTCEDLVYRGQGWPGQTTARDMRGTSESTTYAEAWGTILGRDIAKCCRFCGDGIGLAADISCGDGWFIKDNQADFSEHDGRNIVFARTLKGKKLLDKLLQQKQIFMQNSVNIYQELKIIQEYQYTRRTTMKDKILAMKLCGKAVPNYSKGELNLMAKQGSFNSRIRVFFGTLKRIKEGKI